MDRDTQSRLTFVTRFDKQKETPSSQWLYLIFGITVCFRAPLWVDTDMQRQTWRIQITIGQYTVAPPSH